MSSKSRHTHSLSLTDDQEERLTAVRNTHKISIVKILMATVDALHPSNMELVGGQEPTQEED